MLRRLLVVVTLLFAVTTPVAHADPGDLILSRALPEGRAVLDAAWAAESQGSYTPSLRVARAAAGGAPANLNAVFRSNDGGAAFGLVLGAATGFAAAYPDLPFSSILTGIGGVF